MKLKHTRAYFKENVLKGRIDHLIEHRIPWLVLGLLGGIISTVIISNYEEILSSDIRIAFFITVIVYLSDAVGSQTESVYVRALAGGKKIDIKKYLFRESLIGSGLGILSGLAMFVFVLFWMKSLTIATTVGLTMLINLSIAPVLAILIPSLINKEKMDPALGAGPISTIIQDMISILVYFLIASVIVF